MAKIKSSIQFGLVYIPIVLHSCSKNTDVGFNLIHKKTGQRIKYKKTCEDCPANIPQEDIVKGYEYERDKYIILTKQELDKLKTPKDENIEILQFSNSDEIEPILYEDSFFVEPSGAKKAYALLVKALQSEKKVGIAKAVLGTTETLIALRVIKDRLVLSKLHFADEMQENPVSKPNETINKDELALAKTLISNMTKPFKLENFENEYKKRLQKAIEEKIAGQKITTPKIQKPKKIINLMDALKQSVKDTESSNNDKIVTIKKRESKKRA
ncbi:MAG: Ku protein [Candidatus Caccovivens sp.]